MKIPLRANAKKPPRLVSWSGKLSLLQIPGIVALVIQVLVILALVFVTVRRVKGSARKKALVAKLKLSTRFSRNVISFPTKQTFEVGVVTIIGTPSRGYLYAEQWNTKWRSSRVFIETHDLVLKDLCQNAPLILKSGGTFTAVLPAVRITSGEFKNTLITCINTENLKATSQVQLFYEDGFAKAEVYFKPGLIMAKAEWIRVPITEQKAHEKLVTEICYEERGTSACMVLIEMSKPGTLENKFHYPVFAKVIIAHRDGSGFEDLVNLVKPLPPLLGVENMVLKLTVRRGIVKTITIKSPVKPY